MFHLRYPLCIIRIHLLYNLKNDEYYKDKLLGDELNAYIVDNNWKVYHYNNRKVYHPIRALRYKIVARMSAV